MEVVRDLFGQALTLASGRRGRPAHRWSESNANRVLLGCALHYSDAEIALGLGISVPTLRKHYFSELKSREMQRLRLELWRAEQLVAQGNKGNVGALKEIDKLMERRDRHHAASKLRADDQDEPAPPPLPEGKKAQRTAQAVGLLRANPLLRPNGPH